MTTKAKAEPVKVESPKEPAKISSAEIFRRLDELQRLINLPLTPQAMYIYKPSGAGTGTAFKLQLRLSPAWNEKGYIEEVDGGLFLDLAGQTGKGDDGFARFGWPDAITAKLGIPDISALLAGLRYVRTLGKKVPEALRPKNDTGGVTVGLFHKFGEESTAISLKFEADGSFVAVSKSKDARRSIKLSLSEEIQFESYLTSALAAFQLVGRR